MQRLNHTTIVIPLVVGVNDYKLPDNFIGNKMPTVAIYTRAGTNSKVAQTINRAVLVNEEALNSMHLTLREGSNQFANEVPMCMILEQSRNGVCRGFELSGREINWESCKLTTQNSTALYSTGDCVEFTIVTLEN
jgi:hypothetical protein